MEKSSKNKGFDYIDLSLLTDGLKSEREQGITIDVAYRYLLPQSVSSYSDTPGHIQYTRNMVTERLQLTYYLSMQEKVCKSKLAICFYSFIIEIPHAIVCVNKMDLVDFDEKVYDNIVSEFKAFSSKLDIKDIQFIPISALDGDNVVNRSTNME